MPTFWVNASIFSFISELEQSFTEDFRVTSWICFHSAKRLRISNQCDSLFRLK